MAEAVGIVLGAVPLLISALEHYQDIIGPVVRFKNWRGELGTIILRLVTERASYDQNLRIMLLRAVGSDDLEQMIADPQSQTWRSEGFAEDMKIELGRAYDPCMGLVKNIAGTLETIAANLNIEGSDRIRKEGLQAVVSANPPELSTTDGGSRSHFRKRVDFTMKRRDVIRSLKAIEEDNEKLRMLLEGADKITSIQDDVGASSRARVRFVGSLKGIRSNACLVHRGLDAKFCMDHECHRAGLLLEQRLKRRKRTSRQAMPKDVGKLGRFCVSVYRCPDTAWLDAEINIEDDHDYGRPNGPKVSFSVSTLEDTEKPNLPGFHTGLEIHDICKVIHGAVHPQVGFRLDGSGKLRGLYEIETQPHSLVNDYVTMDKFLSVIQQREHSMPDFYCLVVTLVSSVLQLGETPWLNMPWNRRSIIFLRSERGVHSEVDIKHPYLTHWYNADSAKLSSEEDDTTRNQQNMLALAIMLLELNFGVPIESLRQASDMGADGQPNAFTDLLTAQRWFNNKCRKGQLSHGFKSAIKFCLQCYVDPDASFENAEFTQAIEDQVLKPLESEMQQLVYGRS
ncbi:unnamed protein product [Colletotrichum noveboracense]|uniref:DUF7580 domain-containing protein n=1 Tax=Colletotrichum noveboracense TaxID=2664923 RepID=A0A9W4RMK5_9PEZI|nr:hypothetical protein K456DRAFT_53338 [Colletotrichum gloeosporioides 23]CAI0644042.1 unnamed protein product [Colletotrichum noveboracense]